MWIHHIYDFIKNLHKQFPTENNTTLDQLKEICKSPCFYIGESDSLLHNSTLYKERKEHPVFTFQPEFPFPSFFLEYTKKLTGTVDGEWQSDSSKRILFISEIPEVFKESYQNADFIVTGFWYFDKFKEWSASSVIIAGKWNNSVTAAFYSPLIPKKFQEMTTQIVPNLGITESKEIMEEFVILKAFLEFINCKNVYTETIVPGEKVNKKRIKEHKEPIHEYKILKITKGAVKEKHSSITHPWNKLPSDIITAQHICRGHFKEYTEEGKLFGRYTGRFWWNAQVRGSEKKGIITKDYTLI